MKSHFLVPVAAQPGAFGMAAWRRGLPGVAKPVPLRVPPGLTPEQLADPKGSRPGGGPARQGVHVSPQPEAVRMLVAILRGSHPR